MSEQRLNTLEQTVIRMDGKLDGIAATLQSLARIEEKQMATTERLREGAETMQDHENRLRAVEMAVPEKLNKRLSDIEVQMPGLVESRKWVIIGVLAGIGMIGSSVIHMALKAAP